MAVKDTKFFLCDKDFPRKLVDSCLAELCAGPLRAGDEKKNNKRHGQLVGYSHFHTDDACTTLEVIDNRSGLFSAPAGYCWSCNLFTNGWLGIHKWHLYAPGLILMVRHRNVIFVDGNARQTGELCTTSPQELYQFMLLHYSSLTDELEAAGYTEPGIPLLPKGLALSDLEGSFADPEAVNAAAWFQDPEQAPPDQLYAQSMLQNRSLKDQESLRWCDILFHDGWFFPGSVQYDARSETLILRGCRTERAGRWRLHRGWLFDRTDTPARQWTLKLEHVTGYHVVGEGFEHSVGAVSLGGLHLTEPKTLELITHHNTTMVVSISDLEGELTWGDDFDWSHATKRYRFRWLG